MFPRDPTPEPIPKPTYKFSVTKGLGGQDDNLDILQTYFRELQTMTVETSMDPDLDLITFAIGAHYFGVVMLEETKEVPAPKCSSAAGSDVDAEGEWEVDTEEVDELEFLSRGPHVPRMDYSAAPTPAEMSIPKPITGEEFLALPENEKVLRWREAFFATINGEMDSDGEEDAPAPSPHHGRQLDETPLLNDVGFPHSTGLDKGKQREGPSSIWDNLGDHYMIQEIAPANAPLPPSNDDFINWPEDASSDAGAPPSTADDASSSYPEDFHSLDYAGIPQDAEDFDHDPNVLGRELLQSDDSSEPLPELPEIPEDPVLKKHIMDSAIAYRDQLRAMRVASYEEKKRDRALRLLTNTKKTETPPPTYITTTKPVGLVYLTTSQHLLDPLHMGECNIGAYIAPEYRYLENATDAVNAVVEHAFRDRDCHRLQAIIVDHDDKIDSLTLFSSVGFRHEGTRRRAFYSPIAVEWKDVTYLAMLATEWVMDHNRNPPTFQLRTRSLWDEVLSRHQREQEEIIQMEERKFGHGLKRTNSTETIREQSTVPTALSLDSGAESGASGFATDSSASAPSMRGPISPKRRRPLFGEDEYDADEPSFGGNARKRASFSSDSSSFDSEWDMVAGNSTANNLKVQNAPPVASSSKAARKPGYKSPFSSGSSSSSKWSLFND